MSWGDDYNRAKNRFWQYLEESLNRSIRGRRNPAAYVLFHAVGLAFASGHETSLVCTERELLQYLAGWAEESLDEEQTGGVREPNANHFLRRAYDGLFATIRAAVKENRLRHFSDGRIFFGCLELPIWLVEHFTAEAEQEAESRRLYRTENPFRPFVVSRNERHPEH